MDRLATRRSRRPLSALATAAILLANSAVAQVVRDGSIGPGGSGPVLAGVDDRGQPADYLIHDGLGERAGGNLFHSFSRFDVAAGEVATFTAAGATARVLARVTGGEPSAIFGTLRSTIPGADLFLMNPAGLLFGEGSSVDVPASLHLTTAGSLRFGDPAGTRFPATATPPVLVAAPVAAFGFLDAPGPIEIRNPGGVVWELSQGTTLSLLGGDVRVVGCPESVCADNTGPPVIGFATPAFASPTIRVPEGRVELVAVGSAGDLEWLPELSVAGFDDLGAIQLDSAGIDTRGSALASFDLPGGSEVVARAGSLSLGDDSAVTAESRAGGVGFDARIRGSLDIANSVVFAATEVDAGDVTITQDRLTFANIDSLFPLQSGFFAASFDAGVGGDIAIRADRVTVSVPSDAPSGWSALILTLSSGATLLPDDYFPGAGAAGDVLLDVGEVQIERGLVASLSFVPFAVGGSRNIGDSGLVALDVAGDLRIGGGSFVGSEVAGRQRSGGISIDAARVFVEGAGDIAGAALPSILTSFARAGGEAGPIVIDARELHVLDGGVITSGTGSDGNPLLEGGPGGDIIIHADLLTVAGTNPALQQEAVSNTRATIESRSNGPGDGGSISLSGRVLRVEDGEIFASASSTGASGDLSLDFEEIALSNTARLDAASTATEATGAIPGNGFLLGPPGEAGSIGISTNALRLQDSSINVSSAGADAGSIDVRVGASVELFGSAIEASAAGSGGNVTIAEPAWIILENGSRIVADAVEGQGGNISLATEALLVSENSVISASSDFGVQGEIEVSSPFTDVAQNLTTLPTAYVDAPEETGNRCEASGDDGVGRFVVAGNRGIPGDPDAPLWSPVSVE